MLTLKEWRRARGISQEAMADRLSIHVNTYRAWEEKPSEIKYSKAQEISEILEVDLKEIKFLP